MAVSEGEEVLQPLFQTWNDHELRIQVRATSVSDETNVT
jgi:hypothetical protein